MEVGPAFVTPLPLPIEPLDAGAASFRSSALGKKAAGIEIPDRLS
jgi:hypothetical protein